MTTDKSGTLYIVATPIGNLEDITLRALRTLKEVDFIAAEDTRHSKKLLSHYGISTRLISYYREKEQQKSDGLLQLLFEGKDIALITDAGTPGISDPGSVVVNKAFDKGIDVVPIPGPSALSAALCCAGIGEGAILFQGFAPAKKGARRKLLQSLSLVTSHVVLYESPRRMNAFLTDCLAILGNRKIFIAREMTKNYEEFIHSTLADIQDDFEIHQKGEFVVIISPQKRDVPEQVDTDGLIRWYRDNSSLSLKDCCKRISQDLGISRSVIYKRAIQLWEEKSDHENKTI